MDIVTVKNKFQTVIQQHVREPAYSETLDVWQGRVTRLAVLLQIEGDEYVILSVIPHPK